MKGKWLGTIIDIIEMTFTVPSEKINKFLADRKNILAHSFSMHPFSTRWKY